VTTPGPNFDFFGDEFTRDLAMSAASVCSACCLSHLTAEQLRAAVGTQMQFPCDARDPDCYSNCADWTVTALGVAPGKPCESSLIQWYRPPIEFTADACRRSADAVAEIGPPAEPRTLEMLVYMANETLPADTLVLVHLTATYPKQPPILVTCTSVENVPASSLNLPEWWRDAPVGN
jgi:hypothetical protein